MKKIKRLLCAVIPFVIAVAIIFSTGSNNDVYALTIGGTLGEIGDGNEDGEDFETSVTENVKESTAANTETPTACAHSKTVVSGQKKATTSANGYTGDTVCSKCDKVIKKGSVVSKIGTVTLSTTSYTYTGSALKPAVTVKDGNGKKLAASNYTVKYSSNKNVGKATVTVTFKGNYSGTVKKTFTINPKASSVSKLTAKSKGFNVTWKKVSTQITGYEIQYSTSSKFTSKTSVTKTAKSSKTSLALTKLKAKKKYYVRIRTYTKVSGKTYYSDWSKAKTVTTKK